MNLEDSSAPNCKLPAYPNGIRNPAVLFYLEERQEVLACGGLDPQGRLTKDCFTFDGVKWSAAAEGFADDHCFYNTEQVYVDGVGLWILGAKMFLDSNSAVSCDAGPSSEILTPEGKWITGPPTPSPWGVCAVQVNSTHTFLTGGIGRDQEAWFYNWDNKTWTRTARINQGRDYHGCALVNDKVVIVAGGKSSGVFKQSVESFSVKSESWSTEASLPAGLSARNPSLLSWKDGLLGLFFYSDQVYVRGEAYGEWTGLPGVQLNQQFNGDADKAVLVPDNFAWFWQC